MFCLVFAEKDSDPDSDCVYATLSTEMIQRFLLCVKSATAEHRGLQFRAQTTGLNGLCDKNPKCF